MLSSVQDALAKFFLRIPLPPQIRWESHYDVHYPILKDAFRQSPRAYLRTMLTLDAIEAKKPQRALRRLQKLKPFCENGSNAEKALYYVLLGLYYDLIDRMPQMASNMRKAEQFGHTHPTPHVMVCMYVLFDRHLYEQAVEEADKAINCAYLYPPMTEPHRRFVACCYAESAFALTMMHRLDDAEDALRKADFAADSMEHLFAAAFLRAVQGRRAEAEDATAALKALQPFRYEHAMANIPLILDGMHPHFTAKAPDDAAIRDYWAWFRREENTLLTKLNSQGHIAAFQHHHEYFKNLTPEPAEIDMMHVEFEFHSEPGQVNGQPQMTLRACYSRTYDALIGAMIAACPEDISARWRIVREP